MNSHSLLADQFEAHRRHLQAVAYRMLGSVSEAEDAVQESWLRMSRRDTSGVENMGGWLTTVVARVCLDMLRSRKSRREKPLESDEFKPISRSGDGSDPEYEALLADSVGLALLVVLDRLNPAERVAFVLHDVFAVSFSEIAPIVGRTEAAARQLASRARRRVQGVKTTPDADLVRQRELIESFLSAARVGNFEALLKILDPDIVLLDDRSGIIREVRDARVVAKRVVAGRGREAQPALVSGKVGIIVAPRGKLSFVISLTFKKDIISEINVVSDPMRIQRIDLAVFE
jgi:RNA polymerase sigma-70 factor (ECF subfamily)